MNLDEYLQSKKIDAAAFQRAESALWKEWSHEFETMHPNSFTLQKLNLINPIRRKYPLKTVPEAKTSAQPTASAQNAQNTTTPSPSNTKPAIPKPVFKPKPKMQ